MTVETREPAQGDTHEFQAEVRELLQIMIHSLYSQREIFLRELLSNASDALDKLRFEALTSPELLGGDERLAVQLEVDRDARILRVIDNGIGMSRDEVVQNLGTIARSGTRNFLREMREAEEKGEVPRLIGQFGVGFYSSFMVADEVVVETRRAGEDGGTRWRSAGDGTYAIEDCDRATRGTTIELHLKPVDEESDGELKDFTEEWVLRQIVRRYSDFVEYPIEMEVERVEGEDDDRKTVVETETLNSQKPLWTRPKEEITEDEYTEFYRHVSHDWGELLETIHFRAEGAQSYTALLFLPKEKPFDLFDPSSHKSKVALYVRRVQIDAECEELMPAWLRWVRGVVDSDDLPLNISRETLQHDRQIEKIRKRLSRKVLDALARLLARDRETYADFWSKFGSVVKEGVYYEDEMREDVARACLFPTSGQDEPTTLAEYVERMPAEQEAIYYVTGATRELAEAAPHLEALRAKGWECLYFVDAIDEFVAERLTEFDGKPLRSLERGASDLESEDEKKAREEQQEEQKELLEAIRSALDEHVQEVRLTGRLTESPAVLVDSEMGPSRLQERMMREMNRGMPAAKRVLELNPAHPLVARLAALRAEDAAGFEDACVLLHGQALVNEGSQVPDPARFAKLVTGLMLRG